MMPTVSAHEIPVAIEADSNLLQGDLCVPESPVGFVIFAHGSGSSRRSTRNRAVARLLREERLGTLLVDLLTESEEALDLRTAALRFDVNLLASRVSAALDWKVGQALVAGLPCGLFGASTGAAAALIAATRRPALVHAVVSRGGRPDLAGPDLRAVKAPTLLIVGGGDPVVLQLNQRAYGDLLCERRLEIIAGATHLFPEPGALEQVARLAGTWFRDHLIQ